MTTAIFETDSGGLSESHRWCLYNRSTCGYKTENDDIRDILALNTTGKNIINAFVHTRKFNLFL